MAQVQLYAQATGNYSSINWNTASGGTGTNYSNPQNGGGTTYYLMPNNYVVTIDSNAGAGSGSITCDEWTHASTSDTGYFKMTTGQATVNLTLSNGGLVCNSTSADELLLISGDCSVTINGIVLNGGKTAISCTGSPSVTINGQLTHGGSVYGVSSAGTLVINSGIGTTAVTKNGSGEYAIDACVNVTIIGSVYSTGTVYGIVSCPANCNITITNGSGNTAISGSCPYMLYASNTGTNTFNIVGNISYSGASGISIEFTSTGTNTVDIVGNISNTGAGTAIDNDGSNTTIYIFGNLSQTSTGYCVHQVSGTITVFGIASGTHPTLGTVTVVSGDANFFGGDM